MVDDGLVFDRGQSAEAVLPSAAVVGAFDPVADKAYSSGTIRRQLRSRGIAAVIPEKSDTIAARERRGSRGGRPPKLDTDLYKDRNVVERSFALAKQWRALATRYDTLAITYRAAVTLCAILTWLRQLGDTP